jgi:hypothetical protein
MVVDSCCLHRGLVCCARRRYRSPWRCRVFLPVRSDSIRLVHCAMVSCGGDGDLLLFHSVIRGARRHGRVLRRASRTGLGCLAYVRYGWGRRAVHGSRDIGLGHVRFSDGLRPGRGIITDAVIPFPVARSLGPAARARWSWRRDRRVIPVRCRPIPLRIARPYRSDDNRRGRRAGREVPRWRDTSAS